MSVQTIVQNLVIKQWLGDKGTKTLVLSSLFGIVVAVACGTVPGLA